jgi:hypothetical protein
MTVTVKSDVFWVVTPVQSSEFGEREPFSLLHASAIFLPGLLFDSEDWCNMLVSVVHLACAFIKTSTIIPVCYLHIVLTSEGSVCICLAAYFFMETAWQILMELEL